MDRQESYDNSGLIVGYADAEIDSVLLTVDITEEVMDEAEKLGVGMVISHHPIVFNPLKRLTGGDYVQRVVEHAIRKGIALYACHTNLDAVVGGLSYKVAGMLELHDVHTLDPIAGNDTGAGFGVVGELAQPVRAEDFLRRVKDVMGLQVIRHSDLHDKPVKRISICTGSGSSLIETAVASGADVYIAADFKYNNFLDAAGRIIIADIGHYESEYCAIDLLYDIITKKITTFSIHKSAR